MAVIAAPAGALACHAPSHVSCVGTARSRVGLNEHALSLKQRASDRPVSLNQCAPKIALDCASDRSSLRAATATDRRRHQPAGAARAGTRDAGAGRARARACPPLPARISGGQRRRICIARALVLRPDFIVADEPVSALDVSVRAQVINLFAEVQVRFGLTYLFVSHDIGIVRHIADTVAIMYLGRIVEQGPGRVILSRPLHPYSQALLAAVPPPRPDRNRRRSVIEGDLPSPLEPPSGCPFHTRCALALDRCAAETPLLRPAAGASWHATFCQLSDRIPYVRHRPSCPTAQRHTAVHRAGLCSMTGVRSRTASSVRPRGRRVEGARRNS